VNPGESIQKAINNANEGDTILVKAGTYYESIVVNKTVNVVGESPGRTVIDGKGSAQYIFHVVASNVFIGNFTLKGTNPDPNTYSYAVGVVNVVNVTAKNLIITDVVIGIDLKSSNFTKVFGNQIKGCKSWALRLHEKSCNNTVVGNTFENNPTAIYFADSSSRFSKVYHNNFINNVNHVVSLAVNYFDNGYPSGGNYWSGYTAQDLKRGPYQNETGSDGILDEPYANAPDNYPFAYPLTFIEISIAGEHFQVVVSTNSTLNTFEFNPQTKSLRLSLSGADGTVGACRITIPKRLLSCDQPNQWNILFNEKPNYSELEDEENTYLYFTFVQSSSFDIEIKGTNAIPEVSNDLILLGMLGITLLIVVGEKFVSRRRHNYNLVFF
jgi:nitrous oxidase accessory protein NosD